MALQNVFTLDLDLKTNNYISEPMITSNDSARFIVNITDNGLPYDLTGSTTFTLASTRPDGLVIVRTGTKTGTNQLTFDFGAPSTSVPGRVNAKVQMYDVSSRVSIINFTYSVVKDPTGSTYIPLSYDRTLIQEVLEDGPKVMADTRTATTAANTAVTNANTAIADIQKTNATNFKGTIAAYSALPTTGRVIGDIWVVTTDGDSTKNGYWRWNGTAWIMVGVLHPHAVEMVDLRLGADGVSRASAGILMREIHAQQLQSAVQSVTLKRGLNIV